MKQGIHPENYRLVAFKDMSNEEGFITKSTVKTRLIDTAGRIDKFKNKYAKFKKN